METRYFCVFQIAELFPDLKIVSTLSTQLSWSHFIEILPLETEKARLYYANDAITRNFGIRELRRQISRKAYERREIANSQVSEDSAVPFNVFKDPYLLDTLGLKENFLEADLDNRILECMEHRQHSLRDFQWETYNRPPPYAAPPQRAVLRNPS
jgi:hypothetical protein